MNIKEYDKSDGAINELKEWKGYINLYNEFIIKYLKENITMD